MRGCQRATLAFDGASCVYDGSAEHDLDDPLRLTFTNRSDEPTSAAVFRVGDRTTLAQIEAAVASDPATAILGGGFMDVPSLRRVEVGPAATGEFDRVLEDGRWVIACVTSPDGTDRVVPATIIRIGS